PWRFGRRRPSRWLPIMETTEFINALKQEWDRIEDKYTVMTLAATALLRMWSRRSCIGNWHASCYSWSNEGCWHCVQ
ncbi:hypothetical protein EE612_033498, partial [Oryza sativa]